MTSPYEQASAWSWATFGYVVPLLRLGSERPLSASDLPPLAARDAAVTVAARLEAALAGEPSATIARSTAPCSDHPAEPKEAGLQQREEANCDVTEASESQRHQHEVKSERAPLASSCPAAVAVNRPARHHTPRRSLLLACFAAFRFETITSGVLALSLSLAMLAQPLLLRALVAWLRLDDHNGVARGIGYALGLAVMSLAQALLHHALYFFTMRMGWNLRIGMMAVLHAKLLRLAGTTLARFGAGKVVNLISTDVLRWVYGG